MIAQLEARRQKLRAQWSAGAAGGVFARRYDGGAKYQGQTLDPAPRRAEEPTAPPPVAAPPPQKPPSEGTHIDQLLKAKQKRTGHEERN